MSPDPNDEYFADGMTEELIMSLSRVKQLTVIARTSVMKYKGSEKTASDVGKELNVGSLIEGSVRKAGNRVRITAQLIDTSTEGHLWAENYDKTLDDIFAVQSEIAERVVGELKTKLLDSEKRTLEKKPTENTEAYSNFLRGRELLREGSDVSLKQALRLFEKAIDQDSSFARAYVGAAECHAVLSNIGEEPFDESHFRLRGDYLNAPLNSTRIFRRPTRCSLGCSSMRTTRWVRKQRRGRLWSLTQAFQIPTISCLSWRDSRVTPWRWFDKSRQPTASTPLCPGSSGLWE
jgi:TolB-like protein